MAGQSGGGGSRANYKKARLAESLAASAKQGSVLTDEKFKMRSAVAKNENNAPTKRNVLPYLSPYDQFALNRKDVHENIVNTNYRKRAHLKPEKWSMPWPGPSINPDNKEQQGEGH